MIKEISRRCATTSSEGIACGPVRNNCAVAEMVVDNDGEERFLYVEWIDEISDSVSFEVTTESIFDIMLFVDEDYDKLERIRNEAPNDVEKYEMQFKELVALLKNTLVKDNVYNPYEEYEGWPTEELTEEGIDLNDDTSVWGF